MLGPSALLFQAFKILHMIFWGKPDVHIGFIVFKQAIACAFLSFFPFFFDAANDRYDNG